MTNLVLIKPKSKAGVVLLKETQGRCLKCGEFVPAEVVTDEKRQVRMMRNCGGCGVTENIIEADSNFYQTSSFVCGEGCDCDPHLEERPDGVVEQISTCIALIEIVKSCNLRCPTCFADSPFNKNIDFVPLDEIKDRILKVLARKKKIEILQLSGGEPTLHPQWLELLEWCAGEPRILYVLVNTNGVRLSQDEEFLNQTAAIYQKMNKDSLQFYLQFDGTQIEGQKRLRGADLREVRSRAVKNCERYEIPVTLAMTVCEENLDQIWTTVEFGLKHPFVRGVSFQPEFFSGRNSLSSGGPERAPIFMSAIIKKLVEQSGGLLSTNDFTPLPCGNPNCHTIGWIIRQNGLRLSPTRVGLDIKALQSAVPNRMRFSIEDLLECGCESTELGHLIHALEKPLDEMIAFRLFIKPFMDVRTYDLDRIKGCCTHVIDKQGRLRSFCEYYYHGGEEGAGQN